MRKGKVGTLQWTLPRYATKKKQQEWRGYCRQRIREQGVGGGGGVEMQKNSKREGEGVQTIPWCETAPIWINVEVDSPRVSEDQAWTSSHPPTSLLPETEGCRTMSSAISLGPRVV